jgi:hypothetical protein
MVVKIPPLENGHKCSYRMVYICLLRTVHLCLPPNRQICVTEEDFAFDYDLRL